MKYVLVQFFVTLGIIFLVLLCIGLYLFIADPYNLKPLIFGNHHSVSTFSPTKESSTETAAIETSTSSDVATDSFKLSEAQKQALIELGIDPASVPTTITVEQKICFVGALGEARVADIQAGAVPGAFELLKVKPCL